MNRVENLQVERIDLVYPGAQTFGRDVLDFFLERRAGHLSKWLYSVPNFQGDRANGTEVWADIVRASLHPTHPYYVLRQEVAIIDAARSEIAAEVKKGARLIDLGPGSFDALRDKVFPILYDGRGCISEYVAVDISRKSLDMAQEKIKENFPSISPRVLHHDYIQDSFHYGPAVPQEIAVFFGLTLANMQIDPRVHGLPMRMLVSSLLRLRSHFIAPDANLVLTIDTNRDVQCLYEAYLACAPYYKTVLHQMSRDLPMAGDFDPEAFEVGAEFIPDENVCAMYFVAKRRMGFTLYDTPIKIERGQRLYFHNAYKFDCSFFEEAVAAAGFETLLKAKKSENSCCLYLLKTTGGVLTCPQVFG